MAKNKDNNFSNKKFNNVVITGGGAQLDNIEKYVGTIFASGTRVAGLISDLKIEKNYNKPDFCDIIGTILYDENLHKIKFSEKQSNLRKNEEFQAFYLARSIYLVNTIYSKFY